MNIKKLNPLRCLCPGGRPDTVATFHKTILVSVVREHHRYCPLPDEVLDRLNWQPRPPGPVIVHTATSPAKSHRKDPR